MLFLRLHLINAKRGNLETKISGPKAVDDPQASQTAEREALYKAGADADNGAMVPNFSIFALRPSRRYNTTARTQPTESQRAKVARLVCMAKNSFSKITDGTNVVLNKSRTDRAN